MLVADDALRLERKRVAEERLRKALAPDVRFDHLRDVERVVSGLELAVRLDDSQPLRLGQQRRDRLLVDGLEALELRLVDRQARGLRVPAEAQQQPGLALGDQVEAIAQVQSRDRAPGAAQLAVGSPREADR